jgi:hypothetical protein
VKWCRSKGLKDSAECLRGVDAWRQAWRPNRVRVLIAESHVKEQKGDFKIRVRPPEGEPKNLPSLYVRLVYCLGYGEGSLCIPEAPKSNRGTPQFWKLFQVIAECRVDAEPPQEIGRKLETLRKLQERGVWLVDASIGALAKSGKTRNDRRVKIRKYRTTIRESFERFVWPMVQGDHPKQVWVIGRGVGKALRKLEGMPNEISEPWIISQPNGQNRAQYQRDLKRLVRRISVCHN